MDNKIYYRAGYKYQLAQTISYQTEILPESHAETEWIILSEDRLLTVKEGYAWDGASGPAVQTPDTMRASLFHDACYQLIRLGLIHDAWRYTADRLYRTVCIEDGMDHIRAEYMFLALREFGGKAATIAEEPKVISAP